MDSRRRHRHAGGPAPRLDHTYCNSERDSTPLCKPVKITALRGLSLCTRLTLFQGRAKACSDRATPSYRRYDTLAKSPAPPWIAPSRPQPAASSPLRDLRMTRRPLIATRS